MHEREKMDLICQELGIPKKQIKETSNRDRFIVVVKKSWLKNIVQTGKIGEFVTHPAGFDEWPGFGCNVGYSWTKVYIHVSFYFIFCVYLSFVLIEPYFFHH